MSEHSTTKMVPIPANGVDYRGKIVLAPMVRSGELPCRLLALKYGADLVWGERALLPTHAGDGADEWMLSGPETIDRALIGCKRQFCERTKTVTFSRFSSNALQDPKTNEPPRESILYRIHPELEKGKLIFQIGTAKPHLAVEAAKLVAGDVAGIDVNSGCPKPFSTSGGMGAALLKDPDRLCAILTALVEEVGKPWQIGISVKIRILQTQEQTVELVKRLCATGITGLTVHCRTTPMRPRERAIREQLKAVVQTCHEAGVACVMNGDVEDREQATRLIEEFGADGAMIATAAEKNPLVFQRGSHTGRDNWREVVREYIQTAMRMENRWGNTKFTLAQLIPGKADKTIQISKCKCHTDTVLALGFSDLLDQAKQLDAMRGLEPNSMEKSAKRPMANEDEAHKKARLDMAAATEEESDEANVASMGQSNGMVRNAASAIAA